MPESHPYQAPPVRSPSDGGSGDFPVVGIGASAGGLDACSKLMAALPDRAGMAFILVQHLDPTHESMMVDLLAGHTAMTVHQAVDGMVIEPDRLYVIPPGTYLAVTDGALRLSPPQARHGTRLPFNFLLQSLAEEYGKRAVAVILSGTGADGSLGLMAVKEKSGVVIVQDPAEAGYDGMPRSAIATDSVDLILPVAAIPDALIEYGRRMGMTGIGGSETVGDPDGRFEVIAKLERLYRHIGRRRPGEPNFSINASDGVRVPARTAQGQPLARNTALAELCQRLVLDSFAPAAVLINRKHECLYSLGPTDRYLRVAPGLPTHDLLAMARQDLRIKLRSAIQRADQENARIIVAGGRVPNADSATSFSIDVRPVSSEGEDLLLVCFVDQPGPEQKPNRPASPLDVPQVAELERELSATRTELESAIRNLEISSEEQKAINDEALSVNEEFQSTNEELLASKEELQSLNEELTALNSQIQETLERQRTTSNDLQNVLYSTDVATIFLDPGLNIRFFTPATKLLFSILSGDIGRPLADLNSLVADGGLLDDARMVLRNSAPMEREIMASTGIWFLRRILPYRTQDDGVEGVVITFVDITERKHVADALEAAEHKAQLANVAKSRFLAAASHDLRQPLQTLTLLQGLLARAVEGERARKLVSRLDETLSTMSGMLNTLLDINQIDTGTVRPEKVVFAINDMLGPLGEEFLYQAQALELDLRVLPCAASIDSDPRLLEQMIRNLLSNALKYTERGKVLLGCRRRGNILSIEVWDTGVGIPEGELQTIFEEYHQLDNAARERSRGLGLGLSIVRRLGELLGHRVSVRSQPGKGSVFAIEVDLPLIGTPCRPVANEVGEAEGPRRDGVILVVEDDPELRSLLDLFLGDEGHHATTAVDGHAALDIVTRGMIRPDLILSDYNLPNGMNGLQLAVKLREVLHRPIPVIILTGDTSTAALHDISLQDCSQLNKPVKLRELKRAIQRLLPDLQPVRPPPAKAKAAPPRREALTIFIVDDDHQLRAALRSVLEEDGLTIEDYSSCEAFLEAYRPGGEACLLVDAYLPGMSGLDLLRQLRDTGDRLPAIMITGNSDVAIAVQAMKAGASDFIEKPVGREELLACVEHALDLSRDAAKESARQEDAAHHMAGLTPRQRQIMDMVLAGHPSKNIAADLGISQRTVENHRASIMRKTGSKSLPALARLAVAAG